MRSSAKRLLVTAKNRFSCYLPSVLRPYAKAWYCQCISWLQNCSGIKHHSADTATRESLLKPNFQQPQIKATSNARDPYITAGRIPGIEYEDSKAQYVPQKENPKINTDIKLLAFYLPQFHPFPENDLWWGRGFTEWTNVCKAQPNFVGHYQPHHPIHCGYYDLRVPEVMEEQAHLAKSYGIYGFCFYFYWFAGKTLMETPLQAMLKNPKVDIPFCFTWANENWTRRWDGQDSDVLISQEYSSEDARRFIHHLAPYFQDPRYIRVGNKPMLIVYRPRALPSVQEYAQVWREEILKLGFDGIHLVFVETQPEENPTSYCFDASVEFPPNTVPIEPITSTLQIVNPNFKGFVYDYEQFVELSLARQRTVGFKHYHGVMMSWDNTARRQHAGHAFTNFSLTAYRRWLEHAINQTRSNICLEHDERFVFINAWNEWAEGTHLEPDRKFGYGYLQSTYDTLNECSFLTTPSSSLHQSV